MQREWFGIDRLRLDKFMLLARKFVRALFSMLRDADWCACARAAEISAVVSRPTCHSITGTCKGPCRACCCPVCGNAVD